MPEWLKNPAYIAKFLWTIIGLAQPILTEVLGWRLPGFLNEQWLTQVCLLLTPLVVLLWPNKLTPAQVENAVAKDPKAAAAAAETLDTKPTARPGGSSTMAPIVRGLALALALSVPLAACGVRGPSGGAVKVETPAEHVFAIRAGYVAGFLTPATAYSELPDCDENPQPCSDDDVVVALQKADLSAKAALDAAETVVREHPTLDAAAFIDAAQRALDAARSILATYGIGASA